MNDHKPDAHVARIVRDRPDMAGEVMSDSTCTFLEWNFEVELIIAVAWQKALKEVAL